MRLRLLISVFIFGVVVLIPSRVVGQGILSPGNVGTDISWPNCGGVQVGGTAFGILGVTGGRNFTANPCLSAQATLFFNMAVPLFLYTNTGYPGLAYARNYQSSPRLCNKKDKLCLAYNYGWNAGEYTASVAADAGVHSNLWWLDVETANSWTKNYTQNRQVLSGMADSLHQLTTATTIGFYSTPRQWKQITDNWQLSSAPNWVATGADYQTAVLYCAEHDFTGGGTWLTQFIDTLDRDYVCP